jgi:BolA protein
MSKEKIESILREKFSPLYLEVIDESHKHAGHAGAREGGHFQVIIVSEQFESKKPIERHRMVYDAISPIKGLIHALAMITKTPKETKS